MYTIKYSYIISKKESFNSDGLLRNYIHIIEPLLCCVINSAQYINTGVTMSLINV